MVYAGQRSHDYIMAIPLIDNTICIFNSFIASYHVRVLRQAFTYVYNASNYTFSHIGMWPLIHLSEHFTHQDKSKGLNNVSMVTSILECFNYNGVHHFFFLSPQRSASVVAANSPTLTIPDQSANGSDIKLNKFSRKSIGASPTKQNTTDGHVPNGKNFSNRIVNKW